MCESVSLTYVKMGPSNILPTEYHGATMIVAGADEPSTKLRVKFAETTPGKEMASALKDWKACGSGTFTFWLDAFTASFAEAS
jgi:hypothetical protein